MGWNIHGNEWAAEMLRQHIANGKMRHAYLFSGPKGVGRRTFALRFAQAVNCESPPLTGEGCGTCRTCQQISRMEHSDLAVVKADESGTLKVDQVRDLQRFVSLAPYASNYRIALLLNFEQANANAQNALLKTLEEPNPKVLLLVTVDDAENLLPTITSRCELIRLRPMPVESLAAVLLKEAEPQLEATQANLIAHLAGGKVGTANQMIEDRDILERRTAWMEDLLTLLSENLNYRIAYSRQLTNARHAERTDAKSKLHEGMAYWLSFWRDVMLAAVEAEVVLTNIDLEEKIRFIAREVGKANAEHAVRALEHAFVRLQTANLQLMLDNILLDWPRIKQGFTPN